MNTNRTRRPAPTTADINAIYVRGGLTWAEAEVVATAAAVVNVTR